VSAATHNPRERIWRIANELRQRAVNSIVEAERQPNHQQAYYPDTDADLDMEAYLLIRELVTKGAPPMRS